MLLAYFCYALSCPEDVVWCHLTAQLQVLVLHYENIKEVKCLLAYCCQASPCPHDAVVSLLLGIALPSLHYC